jgi:hypothetical protein
LSSLDEVEMLTRYVPMEDCDVMGKPTLGGMYPPETGVKLMLVYVV